MKAKLIGIIIIALSLTVTAQAQTVAVADLSTTGLSLSPEIAGKLMRIELIKTEKYKVLDKFDMDAALEGNGSFENCYGKNCLITMGELLNVDYIFSGSIDKLGPKFVITIKMVDVKGKSLHLTNTKEYGDHPDEIQRMIQITLNELLGLEVNEELRKRLEYNHDLITSTNVGKVSNAGPRFGVSYVAFGDMAEFVTRDKRNGGLDAIPLMSNMGYQFEGQYVGTENFSALFEVIPNVAGLEQGQFFATISFLNGFRFGRSGWEFAFGPSFGARRMIEGLEIDGEFQTKPEYLDNHYNTWLGDPSNFDSLGYAIQPYEKPSPSWSKRLDTRGDLEFNTNWLMAFGRTFRAGSLNIPVNVYYSGNKYGGVLGASVGFNIVKSEQSINQNF
ncbi:MAG: hypothetical protein HUJ25_06015 [Crocinitomicaceae bacterium]|nr:hypothetical protein [Crocinitomicaceae bacterium]